MKQHRRSSSCSRVASMLLFAFVLPYLLFSRCSADEDESSSRIYGHRTTTMTANDHEAAAVGMHSNKVDDEEEQFAPFLTSSASAERRALVSCVGIARFSDTSIFCLCFLTITMLCICDNLSPFLRECLCIGCESPRATKLE